MIIFLPLPLPPPRSLTGTVSVLIPQLQDLDNWEIKTSTSEYLKTFIGFVRSAFNTHSVWSSAILQQKHTSWNISVINMSLLHSLCPTFTFVLVLTFPWTAVEDRVLSDNTGSRINITQNKLMCGLCQLYVFSVSNMGVRIKDLYLFYQSVYSRQHTHTLITSVAISCSLRWNKLHVVNWKFH